MHAAFFEEPLVPPLKHPDAVYPAYAQMEDVEHDMHVEPSLRGADYGAMGVGVEEEGVVREAGEFGVEGARREPLFPRNAVPVLELEKTVMRNREGCWADVGLMLGRSVRLGFGGGGVMLWPGYGIDDPADPFAVPRFGVDVRDLYHGGVNVPRDLLSRVLRVHCTAWYVAQMEKEREMGDDGQALRVPSLKEAFEGRHEVAEGTVAALMEELRVCFESGDVNAGHAHVAFWLVHALYKKDGDVEQEVDDTLLRSMAEWAGGPAGTSFDLDSNCKGTGLRGAFIQLSLGNIEEAVGLATGAGYLRLAMLIARALESRKEDLRADAEAQLAAYDLAPKSEKERMGFGSEGRDQPDRNVGRIEEEQWDSILGDCPNIAAVSIDERLILLTLAGHVGSVARFLGLSWYRLFILEFFHGSGSCQPTEAQRISAAVHAVPRSGITTEAPHGCGGYTDVVYHLLRLYADPTGSYPLQSGVYANASFGSEYAPMDARFSWLLYQTMTGLTERAEIAKGRVMLADEFATQLQADGLHLWSFYVRCGGGGAEDVLKRELIKNWPRIAADFVEWDAETLRQGDEPDVQNMAGDREQNLRKSCGQLEPKLFLENVLRVPKEWIAEAKAVMAHVDREYLKECECWVSAGTEDGAAAAHELLTEVVFPEMVAKREVGQYGVVRDLLSALGGRKHIKDWSIGGGLILDYLEYVAGVPTMKEGSFDVYRGMVGRMKALGERVQTDEQRYMVGFMADGIAAVERAFFLKLGAGEGGTRQDLVVQALEDLDALPCGKGARLRMMGEYKIEADNGPAVAGRFSLAFPTYAKYLKMGVEG